MLFGKCPRKRKYGRGAGRKGREAEPVHNVSVSGMLWGSEGTTSGPPKGGMHLRITLRGKKQGADLLTPSSGHLPCKQATHALEVIGRPQTETGSSGYSLKPPARGLQETGCGCCRHCLQDFYYIETPPYSADCHLAILRDVSKPPEC